MTLFTKQKYHTLKILQFMGITIFNKTQPFCDVASCHAPLASLSFPPIV